MHPGWALTLSLAVAPQPGPSSPTTSDLLTELASKVATIVGATTPPPNVSINCSSNLLERVCTAEIGSGQARQLVIVTRPHEQVPREPQTAAIPVVLQLRPLIAQAVPVLDAVVLERRLLVLDPSAVTLYDAGTEGWRRVASYPIVASAPWPRDVRGRLIVERGNWDAFIPGGACRGSLDPFRGVCGGEQRPWPIDATNTGLAPGRNYFTTADGRKYFAAASLDHAADARWMLASDEGRLLLLDDQLAAIPVPPVAADDVAAVATSCAPGRHVIVAGPASDSGVDTLRAVRVLGRELSDVAAPQVLAGRVTALWSTPAGDGALVVVRNATTREYEAFHVTLACGR